LPTSRLKPPINRGFPRAIYPKLSRFSPLSPPPSSRRIRVSRVDSPLGGGAPTNTAAAGEVLGAGAPPEGAPTTVVVQIEGAPTAVEGTPTVGNSGYLSFCRKALPIYFIYSLVLTTLQKLFQTLLKLYFHPCNFTYRSLYKIYIYY
jgi:hypothetical protein